MTAGVYALMIAANPNLTPSKLDNILFTTAVDLGTAGWDQYYGWGRVDAFAAVTKARQTGASDTQAPAVAITSPVSGTVQGLVPIDVAATDNVGVTRVELWVNGVMYASDSTSPFGFTWDTTTFANGGLHVAGRCLRRGRQPCQLFVDNVDWSRTAPAPSWVSSPALR